MTVHPWASKYPELGVEPLSTEPLISDDFFQSERELVFRKTWLNVGHLHDVPAPGDYCVREINVCNASVLITRDLDGGVHCFHNVCSHRGNKLAWEPEGSCRGYLRCRFHGWMYDLKGSLVSVTDEENFFEIAKDRLGLTPINTDVWKDFIFINFEEQPTESLEEYLGGVVSELEAFPLDALSLTFRYDVHEATNWKIASDAQNETYHAPMLGPVHASFGDFFATSESGYTRHADFRRLGKHTVYVVDSDPDFVPQGVQGILSAEVPPSSVQLPTQGAFDYYSIFPNFVVGFLPGYMFTYNFWPLSVGETLWEFRAYFPHPATCAELVAQHYSKAQLRDALAEDIAGHENTYLGLASRAKSHFLLQDQEVQIRSFYKTLSEYVQPGAGEVVG